MNESLGADMPPYLTKMSLATPPQQLFESADRMLIQAATIRECAKELKAQLQSLHDKVKSLENTAYQLQHQGVQNRRELNEKLEDVTMLYHHILPSFKAHKPHVVPKIALAVEEGRAIIEQLEAFEADLCSFEQSIETRTDASTDTDTDTDVQSVAVTTDDELTTTFGTCVEDYGSADLVGHEKRECEVNEGQDRSLEASIAVPETSDEEYHTATAIPNEGDNHPINNESTKRKRKIRSSSAAESRLSRDDKTSVAATNKKPRTTIEDCKQRVINGPGCDGTEASKVQIHRTPLVETLSKRQVRMLKKAGKSLVAKRAQHAVSDERM